MRTLTVPALLPRVHVAVVVTRDPHSYLIKCFVLGANPVFTRGDATCGLPQKSRGFSVRPVILTSVSIISAVPLRIASREPSRFCGYDSDLSSL